MYCIVLLLLSLGLLGAANASAQSKTAALRNSSQDHKAMVIFSTYHREYGYKTYDQGAKKIQYIKQGYVAEYRLSYDQLTVCKKDAMGDSVIFSASIDRIRGSIFTKTFRTTNFALLVDSCVATGIDDGFQLNVVVFKKNKQTSLYWSNAYVKPLVELLDIVNEASPADFRFYKSGDKALFIEQLRRNAQ